MNDEDGFLKVTGWRVRSALQYRFKMPDPPADGEPTLVGPHLLWGQPLYWRYDRRAGEWAVVTPPNRSLEEYTSRRASICALAEKEAALPQADLVPLLIQACIVAGLNRRVDIMDAIEFATMLDPDLIARTLARHRGKSATKKLWWIDEDKMYHLH